MCSLSRDLTPICFNTIGMCYCHPDAHGKDECSHPTWPPILHLLVSANKEVGVSGWSYLGQADDIPLHANFNENLSMRKSTFSIVLWLFLLPFLI